MVASTQELRQKLQAYKYEGRERPWGYYALQRWPSIYLTRFAIKLNLTPNQITLVGILLGIIGSILVFFALPFKIAGAFLLYLNILSDKVDGEVARHRIQNNLGKVYLRGVYLDELNHLIIPPLFLLGITLGIVHSFPFDASFLTLLGLLATLSLPFLRVYHSLAPQMFMKKYIKHPELFAPLPTSENADPIFEIKKRRGFLRQVASFFHQFQDFLIIVLLFFVAFVLELIFSFLQPSLLSGLILISFGFLFPLIVLENSIKGFFAIEYRIRDVKKHLEEIKK
jgi:hypothetical protein